MTDGALFIDGNNLAARCFHKLQLNDSSGLGTGCIYGVLKSLKSLLTSPPFDKGYLGKVVVFWDGGRAHWRKSLFPNYKGDRAQRNEVQELQYQDYIRQLDELKQVMNFLPINSISIPQNEADDLIGYFSAYSPAFRNKDKLIYSADEDFLQLLSTTTKVFSPSKEGQLKDVNWLYEKFGILPFPDFLMVKCFSGDSDFIDGYPGVGPVTAAKIVRDLGSKLEDLLSEEAKEYYKLSKRTMIINDDHSILIRNYKLINLLYGAKVVGEFYGTYLESLVNAPRCFNVQGLYEYFIKKDFRSLLLDWDVFTRPFKAMMEKKICR